MRNTQLLTKIRRMIIFFSVVLALSGITAFPVYTELRWLLSQNIVTTGSLLHTWLSEVFEGVASAQQQFPFLFYGFDWLAFAHLVIALLFIGPYKNPVKNIWVIEWGMLTCICILPLAFIAGTIRNIPLFHILIDCSFGIIGIVPLLVCRRWIKQYEKQQRW